MNRLNVSNASAQLLGIGGVATSAVAKDTASVKSVDVVQAGKTDQAVFSAAGGFAAQDSADAGVRTDKVAALQQAIAAGTYNVPSSAVADKVIESLLR
jgi:negative regulator of flagellin synthesis FlgM